MDAYVMLIRRVVPVRKDESGGGGKENLPFRTVCGILSGGCNACQQVESKTKSTMLPVWAALVTSG